MPPLPEQEISLDGTLGVSFVGICVTVYLSGAILLQTLQYYRRYRNDSLFNKLTVAALWLLDFTNTIFIVLTGYYHFVYLYGRPVGLEKVPIWLYAAITSGNLLIVMVHTLYAIRIWRVSRTSWRTFGTMVTVFVISGALATGTYSTINFLRMDYFWQAHETGNSQVFIIGVGGATALDVILACSLYIYVKPQETSFANTRSVVTMLMKYTLASGAATSFCSALGLVSFVVFPNYLIWVASTFFMTKLYATSYLALLSSRQRWRNKLAEPNMDMFEEELKKPRSSSDSDTPMVQAFFSQGSASTLALTHPTASERSAATFDLSGSNSRWV